MDKAQVITLKEYCKKVNRLMASLGHSTQDKADEMLARGMSRNCVEILVISSQSELFQKTLYNINPEVPTPEWWQKFDKANLYFLPELVRQVEVMRTERPDLWLSEEANPRTLQRLKNFFTY